MTYTQAVAYIHSLLKFGMKPGLQRMEAILEELGHPEKKLPVIHVAGTNGKGSTCAMLSSVLQAAGYKTGLFISPYVVSFRERIQVNGVYISPGKLARATERLQRIAEKLEKRGLGPTEFECITALAFSFFAEEQCDVVVLEAGLGGRLDSTNVVEKPLCSVITSIAMDHTSVLGNTLQQIAYEKSGIIKPGCPVVVSPCVAEPALSVIRQTAAERNSPFYQPKPADKTEPLGLWGSKIYLKDNDSGLRISLAGSHQVLNALTAIEAVCRCGLKVSDTALRQGLAATRFPARMELICENPPVILDGAHNPEGAAALAAAIQPYAGRITAVMGMMADKDYETVLSVIAPLCKSIVAVRVRDNPRSLTAAALSTAASRYCKRVQSAPSYLSALRMAKEESQGEPVLICGSFYLAGAIRQKARRFFTDGQK